jgi:hypothetical protein
MGMGSGSKYPGAGHDGAELDAALARELLPALRASAPVTPDLAGLLGAVEADVARERGLRAWLRSRSTALRRLFALVLLVLPALVAAGVGLRPDIDVYPPARMFTVIAGLLLLLATGVMYALRPLHRPALSDSAVSVLIGGPLLVVLVLYALPAAHEAHPASLQPPGATALLEHASACLSAGLVFGTVLLLVLLGFGRGAVRRAWLLSAVAAGIGANLVLQLHCPNTAPLHLVLGHFDVLALLLLGTALVAKFARR